MRPARLILIALLAGVAMPDCRAGSKELTVSPGESLHAAMAELKNGGGVITLKAGIHPVDRSVLFHSNITLQGSPSSKPGDVIIASRGKGMQAAILTNSNPVSNISIRNLTIRGNLKPEEKHYPAKTHKHPVEGMRKGHFGILFTAGGESYDTAENRNITIENVEVTNCSMGIHIKGSRDVLLHSTRRFSPGVEG